MEHTLHIGSLALRSGQVLPSVDVAYVCHGRLDADGGNAILVTHGFTSGPSMLTPGHLVAEGSWAQLLGPGKPFDTERYFVLCSNMLGSSFGTTGPRSLNPATGKPWGPEFPDITLEDIVEVQHRLLHALGVRRLRAVIGPSYGGWQALQWALDHPDMVDAIGALVSDFKHPPGVSKESQRAKFALNPEWHGGWHYERGGMYETLFEQRWRTLQSYGLHQLYEDRYPDPQRRLEAMQAPCREWAARFDPNSLVVLAGAAERFDVRARVEEICARVFLLQCSTDQVFPPSAEARQLLARIRAPTRYVELDSPYGHMASGTDIARWQPELGWLLAS